MKISIAGASGTGKTTLAAALAKRLGIPALDSDHYYWQPTQPRFRVTRPVEERRRLLRVDFDRYQSLVVSGALTGSWGDEWAERLDLVVFLLLPPDVRMARLRAREEQRYGDALRNDHETKANSVEFLAWAEGYDRPGSDASNRQGHEAWLATLSCPVLRLESAGTVEDHINSVVEHMTQLKLH